MMSALQVLYASMSVVSMPLGLLVAWYFGSWVEDWHSTKKLKRMLKSLLAYCLFDLGYSIVFLSLLEKGMR